MNRTMINTELRRQFYPLLEAQGFTRRGDIARRVVGGVVVHVVEVQHRPRSGVFQVNLGAHLLPLGDVSGGPSVAPADIREYDCAWRDSLIAGFRNSDDAEFAYGQSADDAADAVAFVASEWPRQSNAFFAPLTQFPDDFRRSAIATLGGDHHAGQLRMWARVALLLGDDDLARAIVSEALPRVPERATALREDLKRIAGDASSDS